MSSVPRRQPAMTPQTDNLVMALKFVPATGSAGPDACPICRERRVPQYDIELRDAADAVAAWQQVARQLYLTRNLSRRELRRRASEASYVNLAESYNM